MKKKQQQQKHAVKTNVKQPVKPQQRSSRLALNKTYEKRASPLLVRKVSPIVSLEKEMEGRRDHLKESHTLQREEEAKQLLEDMLVENRNLNNRHHSLSSSPSPSRRKAKSSRSPLKLSSNQNKPFVPPLSLPNSKINAKENNNVTGTMIKKEAGLCDLKY